jgi:hypothetical protein
MQCQRIFKRHRLSSNPAKGPSKSQLTCREKSSDLHCRGAAVVTAQQTPDAAVRRFGCLGGSQSAKNFSKTVEFRDNPVMMRGGIL